MITHVAFASLVVTDQDEAQRFFVDTLGFTTHTDAEMAPGKRWLEMSLPGERTHIVLSKGADFDMVPDPKTGPAFNLCCDDITTTHAELQAKGAEVSDPVIEPCGSYMLVSAPDGYKIMISQVK
ncbi:VOC family protein [Streptomyces sp. NPDC055749]